MIDGIGVEITVSMLGPSELDGLIGVGGMIVGLFSHYNFAVEAAFTSGMAGSGTDLLDH